MAERLLCACVLALAWILVIGPKATVALSEESRLIRKLTNPETYDKVTRPAFNTSQTVRVSLGLALLKIYEVNEAKGYIMTDNWFRYRWNDHGLRWNPDDYGGVKKLRIPANLLWRPDIVLYNGVNADTALIQSDNVMATVNSEGFVHYVPQVTLKSRCSYDMRHFPYDEQTCVLKFGSWTYDGFTVDLDFYDGLEEVDTSHYIQSTEWDLVGHPAKKNLKYYPCCEEPYPDLTFHLHIKRMENFYAQVFIVPAVALSLLTPVIFALPSAGAHRYVLGTGLLIALTVTLAGFDELLPRVNSTPLIGHWYVALEILVVIALILSGFVTNLANRASHGQAPPAFIKKILVDLLGRVLCVGRGEAKRLPGDSGGANAAGHPSYWELAAKSLDRLFFLIYCVVFVIFALVCATG